MQSKNEARFSNLVYLFHSWLENTLRDIKLIFKMIYNTIFSERFKNINFLPEKELFLQKGSKLVTLLNLLSLYDSYGPLDMILGC